MSGILFIPSAFLHSAASILCKMIQKLSVISVLVILCAPSIVSSAPIRVKNDIHMLQSTIDGRIQEDVISDDEDWFTNALNGIASFVVSKLSDPDNTEEERKYLKVARLFIEPLVEYHDKVKPNDKVANKILHGIQSFLSLLEDKVNDPAGSDISQLAFAA